MCSSEDLEATAPQVPDGDKNMSSLALETETSDIFGVLELA
jgi:hypothetical protein